MMPVDGFFHRRVTGARYFRLCGFIRVAYAFLVLCDKLLLTVDFEWFFLSGMMPYDANSKDLDPTQFTLFWWTPPDSPRVYWLVHFAAIIHAILLLLGVFPKFQLVCLHLAMLSFYHHNSRLWDGEDDMFRMWNLMLFFLPLHHCTVFDLLRPKTTKSEAVSDSWPMWPFRLWQIQVCFIYFGAGFGKLQNPRWSHGHALHHIIHTTDFFGGMFTPSLLFDRVGPLQILTFTSLLLESTCYITVWIAPYGTVSLMILLHLGIELGMNMHCFEWLSILGWLVFLVKPDTDETKIGKDSSRRIATTVVLLIACSIIGYQTTPLEQMFNLVPASLQPTLVQGIEFRNRHTVPFLETWGWRQDSWDMYSGAPSESFYHEAVDGNGNAFWTSPKWDGLSWYEQKRWQRPMTFYDGLEDAGDPARIAFGWYLAKEYNVTTSVQILKHVYEPEDEFWEKLGKFSFWDKAKYKVELSETREVLYLNICEDLDELCGERVPRDGCFEERFPWMQANCRKSCNFCAKIEDAVEGSSIIVYSEEYDEFVDASVHDIRGKKYLLDYGPSFTYEERFEWVDVPTLRSRAYVLLDPGVAYDDEVEGEAV